MNARRRRRADPVLDGVLLVDKPSGPTSHDVVQWVRWALGVRRVGHCGTLDPMATGLLVVTVGMATKLVPLLTGQDKVYRATVVLGQGTTTGDAQGTVVAERPVDESTFARIPTEVAMLRDRDRGSPLDALRPVVTLARLRRMIATVRSVHVSPAIEQYAVAITGATRADRELRLGASPRATLHLVHAAKARAALDGRDFVLPDDIDALAVPVLAHRLVPARAPGSALVGDGLAEITARIVAATPVPLETPAR